MAGRYMYQEIAKAKVNNNGHVVISSCSNGGFTIARQMKVNDGEKDMTIFLKGAIHINDLAGLISIRDAINATIEMIEKTDDGEEWD